MSRYGGLENGKSGNSENTGVSKVEARSEGEKSQVERTGVSGDRMETKAQTEAVEAQTETKREVANGKLEAAGTRLEEAKLETVRREDDEVKKHFETFQDKRWEDEDVREGKKQILSESRELSEKDYEAARMIAEKDEMLNRFSDHTSRRHVPQVTEKTLEQIDQYKEAVEKSPDQWGEVLSARCSENTTMVACTFHDVGMAGKVSEAGDPVEQYEESKGHLKPGEKPMGEQIRSKHSIEGAMSVLSKREEFDKMNDQIRSKCKEGEEPDLINPDEAALLIALHSKNAEIKVSDGMEGEGSKGLKVADLSNTEEIQMYAEEMKKIANERGLQFEDGFLYREGENGERVVDEEAIRRVRTEAAALRQGDSFRPASEIQVTQSGLAMMIEVSPEAKSAQSIDEEMKAVRLAYYDETGAERTDMRIDESNSGNTDSAFRSKVYAAGEKNLADIKSGEIRDDGSLCTDVYLVDGNFCPFATGNQISERMREAASLDNDMTGRMVYRIHSETPISEDSKDKMRREIESEMKDRYAPKLSESSTFIVEEDDDDRRYGGFVLEFV